MINIFYSKEDWMGLPGPYLLYRGSSQSFLQLYDIIEKMIVFNKSKILLNELDFIKIHNTDNFITYEICPLGNTLCKVGENFFLTSLSKEKWRLFLKGVSVLSNSKFSITYEFDEFEEHNLFEDCMIIFET